MDTNSTGQKRSRAWLVPVSGVLALLLAGCGGDGINVPSPTRTDLPSVSVSIPSRSPSVEAPETATPTPEASEAPTETPEPTPTETPEPTPTETPEPAPTPRPSPTPRPTRSVVVTATVTPTTSVTETATATATETPTPTETATPTPEPTTAAAPAATDAEDGGLPAWLWWVLAALLAALAAYLILRARRRAAWDAELAEAEAEVSWLGRELLAQLQQTTTTDALAGGWQVSAARVREVEDRLTGLEASAPDEQRAARATELRDAVRSSRTDVETLISTRDQAGTPVVLATATSRLLEVLNPTPPPPPTP
jgi:hypothetical protein